MRNLLHHAAELGVRVHLRHLDGDLLGGYWADDRLVCVDLTLTPVETRWVLAHELGHVFHGHDCDTDENEHQADLYAAKLLVDPAAYAAAEQLLGTTHAVALAEELDVMEEAVTLYQRHCLRRVRGAGYALPRHGRRQSAYAAVDTA